MADLVGVVSRLKARGLPQINDFIICECTVQVRAFDVDLMEL